MQLSHQDLDALVFAVRRVLGDDFVARSPERLEQYQMLLTRLKVRRVTTRDGD